MPSFVGAKSYWTTFTHTAMLIFISIALGHNPTSGVEEHCERDRMEGLSALEHDLKSWSAEKRHCSSPVWGLTSQTMWWISVSRWWRSDGTERRSHCRGVSPCVHVGLASGVQLRPHRTSLHEVWWQKWKLYTQIYANCCTFGAVIRLYRRNVTHAY